MKKKVKPVAVPVVKSPRVAVSDLNVRRAAARLIEAKLVSTEIAYIQRVLGATATQNELDEKVLAVRKMPWRSIALAD